jgi:hypothetical protein
MGSRRQGIGRLPVANRITRSSLLVCGPWRCGDPLASGEEISLQSLFHVPKLCADLGKESKDKLVEEVQL